MNARGTEITTPNPRAEPPSPVKNVEESRQQRLQRAQSRFRDRGGIFVPTNRNTLIDILLAKKDASPKKSRRSRSRSVSPQKPLASPTTGKGKRVSLSSSAAIAAGKISVSQPELRRSPRKKATAASSKPSTSRQKIDASTNKVHEQGTEDENPVVPTKSRKGKQVAQDLSVEDEPMKKTGKNAKDSVARGTKGKAKERVKRGRKAKATSEASSSRLSSQAHDSDADDLLLPSKSRTKSGSRTTRKSSKSRQAATDDDDDDVPIAAIKSRSQTTKRKLSIVQEEEDDDTSEAKPARATGRAVSSPPPPPSRKKLKVAPPPERSPSPPPVKRSNSEVRDPKPTKPKAGAAGKKSTILSDGESDGDPPLPKATQKKSTGPGGDVKARPTKKTVKGKGKALVVTDEAELVIKGKGKAVTGDEIGDSTSLFTKATSRKAHSAADNVDLLLPKGRTKGRIKPAESSFARGETSESKSQARRGEVLDEPGPEMPVPKRSRSRAKATAQPLPDDGDPPAPAKSKRKRPTAPIPEEDDSTPTKRVKTLPLQDVDEQSPPSKRKGAKGGKAPGKAKPTSKGDSRKLKENTPTSDCSEGRPATHTRSRSKPSSKIAGPRKSVMVRMLEPLPPIEDNDPDPIDFLS